MTVAPSDPAPVNRTLHITAAVVGVTLAIAGLHHGFFEVLQGNRPTPGLGIHSIGPDDERWAYGTDDAITVVPNFLVTGAAAMAVSLAIAAWSVFGLKRCRGPSVFLALFVVLTLVGGGMGHIPFFVTAWAWAARIRGELPWWRRRLGAEAKAVLPRGWLPSMVAFSTLFLLGLELSVFGYPPLAGDPDGLLLVIWSIPLASLVSMNVAFVGAVARDLERAVGPGRMLGVFLGSLLPEFVTVPVALFFWIPLVGSMVVYDLRSSGRVHAATAWGATAKAVSVGSTLVMVNTGAAITYVDWLRSLALVGPG